MGKTLRDEPTTVIAELSAWLSNPDSPALWAPFAFSIRGLAYEVMDECDLARMDYVQGLNLYDTLMEELGEEVLQRMANNMKFMRVRLEALPPTAVSPVESYFVPSEVAEDNNMQAHSPIFHGESEEPDGVQAGDRESPAIENLAGDTEWQEEWQEGEVNERQDEPNPDPDPEITNQPQEPKENWEDDPETTEMDATSEPVEEGHTQNDANQPQADCDGEENAVNNQMAEAQGSGEVPPGNVDADEPSVELEMQVDATDANPVDTQENPTQHDDEEAGQRQDEEGQDAGVNSKAEVNPEAEAQPSAEQTQE